MKHILTILLSCLFINHINAQSEWMTTFETATLNGADTFWNGSDGNKAFFNNEAHFLNSYDTQWKYWSGFAVSSKSDKKTTGFLNEFSAFTGIGCNFSKQYAVISSSAQVKLTKPQVIHGCYITNSTYAAISMRDGDGFAKKFGGASGNDKDYFKLTATGLGASGSKSLELYLADYQSDINNDDYILSQWTYFDLSALGEVDSIKFSLSSSDTGQWGMNTPAYFCMDNFNAPNPANKHKFNTCDFNNLNIEADSFRNGSDLSGGFLVNGYFFENVFNSSWNSWSGFASSRMFDTMTSDYTNEFSSIAGKDTGNQYVMGYNRSSVLLPFDEERYWVVNSHAGIYIKVSNSTYGYRTMQDGNAFAKKFGGASGKDKDFLVLKIVGYGFDGQPIDTVEHYLADFRSDNSGVDYIQKDWSRVEVSKLFSYKNSVRIDFWIEGSDTGQYGLNTPAYFCLDDAFEFVQGANVSQINSVDVKLYPNPSSQKINVKTTAQISEYQVFDLNGRHVQDGIFNPTLDISTLLPGIYILHLNTQEGALKTKFIKQ